MTTKLEASDDYLRMRVWGVRAELCLDDRHDIVVTVPSPATGVARIAGYVTFEAWRAAGTSDARVHLMVTMARAFLEAREGT